MKKVIKLLPTGIKIQQVKKNGVVQIKVGPATQAFTFGRPRFEDDLLQQRIDALASDENIRIKNFSLN